MIQGNKPEPFLNPYTRRQRMNDEAFDLAGRPKLVVGFGLSRSPNRFDRPG
jgi:hypothetical protein